MPSHKVSIETMADPNTMTTMTKIETAMARCNELASLRLLDARQFQGATGEELGPDSICSPRWTRSPHCLQSRTFWTPVSSSALSPLHRYYDPLLRLGSPYHVHRTGTE